MRQAKKLGLLGLAVALVAAFGLIVRGTQSVPTVSAQESKTCIGAGGTATQPNLVPGNGATCTVVVANVPVPALGSLQETLTVPAGQAVVCVASAATTAVATGATCQFNTTAGMNVGAIAGTFSFTIPANTPSGTTIITDSAITCTNQVLACAGGTINAQDPSIPGGLIGNTQLDPNSEVKWCTNSASTQGLTQVIGGNTLDLSVTSGTSFTIPLFGGASTCVIQLLRNGVPCNNLVPPGGGTPGTNPCADGYVTASLSSPGSTAVLNCGNPASLLANNQVINGVVVGATANPFLLAGLPNYDYSITSPIAPNNAGTCQSQTSGTSVLMPCGQSAFTLGSTTIAGGAQYNTCTAVVFEVGSVLGGCISGQTTFTQNNSACPLGNSAYTLGGASATITISFQATGFNSGINGGVVLGTNTFSFQAPGVGTLLVTATPQLIPSNGTLASVITATFACGTGFSLTNTGFPLSSFFAGTTSQTNATFAINQPILGGGSAVCGAGLPGTFTFATPGEVIFDNGRTSESVGCGLNGQQNLFGGSNLFNPNNLNPTLPLVFTCTGAAVLAIGGGAAGDAPINVTYASAVGGLVAVGSTLVTVAPSGVPRISVACNPSTIAAGNTGSLCTATVTDQNGTPLTGSEGATVTWTVSDTTVAQILPCVVNLGVANGASALNITTSPNIIPQIVPNTPCNPASGSIPGQSVTFLNGQTTALLVASSYAHPEVVTVSAVLGVLVPPEYACEVSPYTPVGYGASQFLGSAAPSGFLPGLTGCGAGNPVGFTGLASALSTAGSAALNGIVTLPNATSASTTVSIGGPAGILVVGATTSSPLGLLHGCNNIIVTTTAGTPIANIAALVSPSAALVSIWAFNNSTKQFRAGFFSDPAAPVDYNVTGNTGASQQGGGVQPGTALGQTSVNVANGQQVTESYFICVNQAAEIISG